MRGSLVARLLQPPLLRRRTARARATLCTASPAHPHEAAVLARRHELRETLRLCALDVPLRLTKARGERPALAPLPD